MGNNTCRASPEIIDGIFLAGQVGGIIPDITLDRTVSNSLSSNSSFALSSQYVTTQERLSEEQLALIDKNLLTIFGRRTKLHYGGVGVVALAMSLLLDTLVAAVVGKTDTRPADQCHFIFGSDNTSDISDLTCEYLRLLPQSLNESVMADLTDVYDQKLKVALINFYNSMTVERKLSTAGVKQWINGAAVHLHIRLHGVRLSSVPRGSAESLRLSYRTGLAKLLQLYASYLRHNVKERTAILGPPFKAGFLITEPMRKVRHRLVHSPCQSPGITSAIVAKILTAQNLGAIENFFDEASRIMDILVHQEEDFVLSAKNPAYNN